MIGCLSGNLLKRMRIARGWEVSEFGLLLQVFFKLPVQRKRRCSNSVFIGKLKHIRFLSWDFIFFFFCVFLFHTDSCSEAHSSMELTM